MYDFLGIGDITSDSFITLQNAKISCSPTNEECSISIPWGTKLPYERVDIVHGVGNAANASVSAKRLGLRSALITSVGNDDGGYKCREVLAGERVATKYVNTEKGKKTNHHYVLSHEAERTILVKHESFTYILPEKPASIVYLSSLSEGTETFHHEIVDWLNESESFFVFQPGTFQLRMGIDALTDLYKRCHLFICNKEEAQFLLQTTEQNIPVLCHMIVEKGPSIVSITDGPNGAFVHVSFNNEMWFIPQYPDKKPPVDRTGAGDAFSSTLAVYTGEGMSPDQALRRAPINSMSVVQHTGAQKGLLTREEVNKYLTEAPESYSLERK